MSSRRPQPATTSIDAQRLRHELEALKQQNAAVEAAGAAAEQGLPSPTSRAMAAPEGVPAFDQLSQTEQAAGSLGVHPEAWKPIKCAVAWMSLHAAHSFTRLFRLPRRFLNEGHFETLKKSNALDEDLARRIEAYRHVSAQ